MTSKLDNFFLKPFTKNAKERDPRDRTFLLVITKPCPVELYKKHALNYDGHKAFISNTNSLIVIYTCIK